MISQIYYPQEILHTELFFNLQTENFMAQHELVEQIT